jgi:hypothetical protein
MKTAVVLFTRDLRVRDNRGAYLTGFGEGIHNRSTRCSRKSHDWVATAA